MLAFALALLLGTACACPSPTTPTGPLIVTPTSATLVIGKTRQFCAGGMPTPYSWTFTGGTFTTSGSFCIMVTAGNTVGTYPVTVSASGQTATATLIVVAQ